MSQEQSQDFEQMSPLNSFSITKTLCAGRNFVYHAFDNKSNRQVVLKTFSFISRVNEGYVREKTHLMNLDHPNIVQLYEAVEKTTSAIGPVEEEVSYLALEYAPYGDMLEIISKRGAMPEILARTLFQQMLEALSYLHNTRNIAHLDLKVDNIMIDADFNLKLIDFDLSQPLDSSSIQSKGTPGYRAPELKKGSCTNLKALDIYSAAVVLFILITGYPPYGEIPRGHDSSYDIHYKLLRSNVTKFWEIHSKHKNDTDFYSEDFKSLITSMLDEEPDNRPSIDDIINTPWFQGPVLNPEEYRAEMKNYLKIN
jgi:serine/threonine protein kinase